RTARTLDDVSGFDFCLPSREVREENFLFLAVFASETEIPLAGGKGAHFSSSISTSDNGREERGFECACSYKARQELRSRKKVWSMTLYDYFLPPTETIFWMSFGSSGSSPDFGNRGVSVIQFRSIANTRRKRGNDSSTRPMLTRATACQ